jgi:hypothetical protein
MKEPHKQIVLFILWCKSLCEELNSIGNGEC